MCMWTCVCTLGSCLHICSCVHVPNMYVCVWQYVHVCNAVRNLLSFPVPSCWVRRVYQGQDVVTLLLCWLVYVPLFCHGAVFCLAPKNKLLVPIPWHWLFLVFPLAALGTTDLPVQCPTGTWFLPFPCSGVQGCDGRWYNLSQCCCFVSGPTELQVHVYMYITRGCTPIAPLYPVLLAHMVLWCKLQAVEC